jgi:hypothetical protein
MRRILHSGFGADLAFIPFLPKPRWFEAEKQITAETIVNKHCSSFHPETLLPVRYP